MSQTDASSDAAELPDQKAEESLTEAAQDGELRTARSFGPMFAIGVAGGVEVALGLMAFLLVLAAGGSHIQAALAFGIGFVMLALAGSELFTENFLVPVVALATKRASVGGVAKLWTVTLLANFIGGGAMIGLLVLAFPEIHEPLRESAGFYIEQPIGLRSFALALLGGATITVFTWIERGSDSQVAAALAAYLTGFLLLLGPLNHSVVGSIEMMGALMIGAEFAVLDWVGIASWMVLGNAIGGIALVTVLRLIRVGPDAIRQQRHEGLEACGFERIER